MCDVMERRSDLNAPRRRLFHLIEETPKLVWMLLTKRPQEFSKSLPKTWLQSPRPNVWLLTTVETEDYLWRIEELLKAPAVVHGVSMEPLLGPITLPQKFLELGQRAWAITGGESGPGAQPTKIELFRTLRDQSVNAGVPFFFKQWGEHDSELVKLGKKQAGRILDGRTWDQFPTG
jgi:protein gp37